jgi:DNA mismatch endonuclease, patch repair protein
VRREADVLFVGPKVAVFVDSCFWHCCPEHGTWPSANGSWWREKLEANRRRDRDTDARLHADGWAVVRIWEHEDPRAAAVRVREVVRERVRPAHPPS